MGSPKLFAYPLFIVFALSNTSTAKEKGFVRIFDGKTLNGWEPTKGSENAWHAQDGILVGTGDKGRGYLTYIGNQSISDLEMTFSYRFPGEGNSGVSIRAAVDETRKRDFKSYHADLGHKGIGHAMFLKQISCVISESSMQKLLELIPFEVRTPDCPGPRVP